MTHGGKEGVNMDFYRIKEETQKNGTIVLYPDFKICRSKDLMVRGKSFYAIWDQDLGLWSTDEYDVQRLIDEDLEKYKQELSKKTDSPIRIKSIGSYSSSTWTKFKNYISSLSDNEHQLDEKLTFANDVIEKNDYVSKRLPYPIEEGNIDNYEELISTLYDPEERAKIEWAIGAVISGDSKTIQKFLVFYGEAGAGKSTVLNIIQKLFQGYYTTFEAKALVSSNNQFATEVFKTNPLVAIQHDGDLSKIEDNTKLNSIVSHEEIAMNEKYKATYTAKVNCFLFMATNRPVKITDAKSGIIRRLIDVKPSGRKLSPKKYAAVVSKIDFELGAIAYHCLKVYQSMGKNYYAGYKPIDMMFQTDVFFNFVEDSYPIFKNEEYITLSRAYAMYKTYCDEALVDFKLPKYKFREELKNYFEEFLDRYRDNDVQLRSVYRGFLYQKFTTTQEEPKKEEHQPSLVLDCTESIFDKIYAECPAQYANSYGTPCKKWSEVTTKLKDIDTKRLHFVMMPKDHIFIDFDLKDENGEKSFEKNLEAASKWPATYSEISKSGSGIHLHYTYLGDTSQLSRLYSENIEIKVFTGNSSLRRQLTKCNNLDVSSISSGLPLKGIKMINFEGVKNERHLRSLILQNLEKKIHPGTKPSIDFINTILDNAYKSGMMYDISDLRPRIMAFANNSTHHSEYCLKIVSKMKFKSEENSTGNESKYKSDTLVFFDVEVFPNLFLLNWKFQGAEKVVRCINPEPKEIEELLKYKLVGFNNRRYDNHILYARYIGYTNKELYELSQRLISKDSQNGTFGEAYNLSYTDVYDFASAGNKKSLKAFEIELGIHHQELGLPWDKPVDESLWEKVAEYCDNDVIATEKVFEHLKSDWTARQILAELSGLTVNDTTNKHTTKIIFGNDKNPQSSFVYTDLSTMFPGYQFDHGVSTYRGEKTGEGGYVYAEPGAYKKVALLDVESMHPTSIEQLNLFGKYTEKFSEIKRARLAIKHGDFKMASSMMGGKLAKYLNDKADAKNLSNALKTVINSVYGLTSAKYQNEFKDPRNIDNIVAKRGALFMIDLKHAVQEKGYTVAHIKTDSIKIPDADDYIIKFVKDFGKKYGYNFDHEATYEKMCLVNNAVYIAKYVPANSGEWTATGAQFAQPYVYKTLFTKEPIQYDDLTETKSVTSSMYLDFNENLEEDQHNYQFVGKVGCFLPVKPGFNGGVLLRQQNDKYYAVTGTTGFRWVEYESVQKDDIDKIVDEEYHKKLVNEAIEEIEKYIPFDEFINSNVPWEAPCGESKYACKDCQFYSIFENTGKCALGYDVSQIINMEGK